MYWRSPLYMCRKLRQWFFSAEDRGNTYHFCEPWAPDAAPAQAVLPVHSADTLDWSTGELRTLPSPTQTCQLEFSVGRKLNFILLILVLAIFCQVQHVKKLISCIWWIWKTSKTERSITSLKLISQKNELKNGKTSELRDGLHFLKGEAGLKCQKIHETEVRRGIQLLNRRFHHKKLILWVLIRFL